MITTDDPLMHLTNYCVQSEGDNSIHNEELLLPFEQLLLVLERSTTLGGRHIWHSQVWPRVLEIVRVSIEAGRLKLSPRNNSFELLGYDIILDHDLNPWLLEINLSPSIAAR